LQVTVGKKPVLTPKIKATKGLKRNLKNWEAFMEEDDHEIAVTGLAFDMELDLDIETDVQQPRRHTAKTNKRNASAG
jgi:hypothetical protein